MGILKEGKSYWVHEMKRGLAQGKGATGVLIGGEKTLLKSCLKGPGSVLMLISEYNVFLWRGMFPDAPISVGDCQLTWHRVGKVSVGQINSDVVMGLCVRLVVIVGVVG